MQRLTNSGTKEAKSNTTIKKVCDKLSDFEDLEEQGRLVKLPCSIGDRVYRIQKKESVIEMRVARIYCKKNCIGKTIIWFDVINIDNNKFENLYFVEDIGKTIFLTKSEAEEKLKELRGGTDEAVKQSRDKAAKCQEAKSNQKRACSSKACE